MTATTRTRGFLWLGQRMGFPGHRGQCGGDGLQVGFDVGGGGGARAVGVAGVGACDAVAVVAFDPGQCGVAQPVGGDSLSGDPGELVTESFPEVVVASGGQFMAVPGSAAGARPAR